MNKSLCHGSSSAVLDVETKTLIWTRNTFLVVEWYKNQGEEEEHTNQDSGFGVRQA